MGYLKRTVIAVVSVILFYALVGPVSRILGFSISTDLFTVLRIAVAGLALGYIFFGTRPPNS